MKLKSKLIPLKDLLFDENSVKKTLETACMMKFYSHKNPCNLRLKEKSLNPIVILLKSRIRMPYQPISILAQIEEVKKARGFSFGHLDRFGP